MVAVALSDRQINESLWAYLELQWRVKLVGGLECWDVGLQLFTGACEEAQDCVRAAGAGGQTYCKRRFRDKDRISKAGARF